MPSRTTQSPEPGEALPLKPVDFLILLELSGGESHGYALMRAISARTDGTVRLEAGNLYRSIRRLIDADMVVESERRPAPDADDERRRYYTLTPFGKRVLAAEAIRMRGLVRFAESKRIIRAEPS